MPASTLALLIALAMAALVLLVNVAFFRHGQSQRLQRAALWAPLAGIVSGTVRDGKLIGTYRGYPVEARPQPPGVKDRGDGGYFIDLHLPKRGSPWTLVRHGLVAVVSTGRAEWVLQAGAATRRLTEAGLVRRIRNEDFSDRQDWPIVKYERYRGLLTMDQPCEDGQYAPSVDAFRRDLDLMVDLADINQGANTR